jgi:hypothetical protein
LITASHLISLLESSIDFNNLGKVFGYLDMLSETISSPLSLEVVEFLSECIPEAVYKGVGYRFVVINKNDCLRQRVFPTEQDTKTLTNIDELAFLSYFSSYRKENLCSSWSRDLSGLKREIRLQRILRGRAVGSILFIIKAEIRGICLEIAAKHLLENLLQTSSLERKIQIIYPTHKGLIKLNSDLIIETRSMMLDFGSSKEIIVERFSNISLIKVFDAEEFILLRKGEDDL